LWGNIWMEKAECFFFNEQTRKISKRIKQNNGLIWQQENRKRLFTFKLQLSFITHQTCMTKPLYQNNVFFLIFFSVEHKRDLNIVRHNFFYIFKSHRYDENLAIHSSCPWCFDQSYLQFVRSFF